MICTIILLVLVIANFGFECGKDGQTKESEYSWVSSLIATVITIALFYGAGMFDKFGL